LERVRLSFQQHWKSGQQIAIEQLLNIFLQYDMQGKTMHHLKTKITLHIETGQGQGMSHQFSYTKQCLFVYFNKRLNNTVLDFKVYKMPLHF
jgi:hypothetical protein